MDPRDSPLVSLPLRWRLLPFVAAAAAVITVYAGVLDAPFVFDDVKLVKENQRLRSGLGDPGKILETFDVTSRRWDEEELRPNYRPVRFLSYLLDYEVSRWWFGDPPGSEPRVQVFHATSILLHALNALLVVLVARSLAAALLGGARDDADPALSTFLGLCAGLLFALHPIETEAVTYISGRRDVLSTAFFLGALALHLRVPPEKGPGPAAVILVPLFLVLGFYSKEMVVTLPAVLLLADLARGARWKATRILVHVLSWGAAAVMTLGTISNETLIAAAPAETGPGVALTASRYVARYLGLVLLPLEQSVDYSFDAIPPSSGLLEPATTLPAVLLVLSILLAALWRLAVIVRSPPGLRPGGALAIGGLWFLGTLVPVLQLVPIPERFAERFAYLPSIGVILVVASLLARARRVEKTFGWGLLLFLAVLSLALSVRRNRDWETPLRLWTSAVEAEPRAARAHLGRANALKEEGRHREAVEEYTTALEIFGEKPEVPLHHGSILQALTLRGGLAALLAGEDPALLDRAVEDYRRVLGETDTDGTVVASSPRHVGVRFDLAGFLRRQGKVAEAEREYRAVIALPGCPIALVGGSHY
ncbi:MAG TPA: tetratricopeptide repeat protein, partial [Planctomycetota bacterium]|nr:tetratricopeptide repeat protein [Planctomycetota bacterium]